jgi:hypothetical protein
VLNLTEPASKAPVKSISTPPAVAAKNSFLVSVPFAKYKVLFVKPATEPTPVE